jgi:hypothetical protein
MQIRACQYWTQRGSNNRNHRRSPVASDVSKQFPSPSFPKVRLKERHSFSVPKPEITLPDPRRDFQRSPAPDDAQYGDSIRCDQIRHRGGTTVASLDSDANTFCPFPLTRSRRPPSPKLPDASSLSLTIYTNVLSGRVSQAAYRIEHSDQSISMKAASAH